MSDTPRTDANGVVATIYRDGYWSHKMPEQDPFPYLSQHGPIDVCLASELAAIRAQLAERDAKIAALKGHAEAMHGLLIRTMPKLTPAD